MRGIGQQDVPRSPCLAGQNADGRWLLQCHQTDATVPRALLAVFPFYSTDSKPMVVRVQSASADSRFKADQVRCAFFFLPVLDTTPLL